MNWQKDAEWAHDQLSGDVFGMERRSGELKITFTKAVPGRLSWEFKTMSARVVLDPTPVDELALAIVVGLGE